MNDFSSAAPSFPMPHAPEPAHNTIFTGRFGLRAGWGIALYIVVVGLALSFVGGLVGLALSHQLKPLMAAQMKAASTPGHPKPDFHVQMYPSIPYGEHGTGFVVALALCFLLSKIERRPFRYYGLGKSRWTDIFPGAAFGLIMLSVVIGGLYSLHLLVFDGQNLHGSDALWWGFKWLVAFLIVGFAEEYIFRGYLQYTFMRGLWGLAEKITPANPEATAFWLAAIVTSLIFAATHTGNGGENLLGILQVFMAGIALVWMLWRTGSLWLAIGFHTTWDWAQSFLFGVADSGGVSVGRLFITHPQGKTWLSGGSAGPEGSIFATIALLITIALLRFVKRGPLPSPEQLPDVAEPTGVAPGVA